MQDKIGETAGHIWRYLNENGQTSMNKVKNSMKLNDRFFYMAVGWLAREGKVQFSHGEKSELLVSVK